MTLRQTTEARLSELGVRTEVPLPPIEEVDPAKTPHQVGERMVELYSLAGLANDADPQLLVEWLGEIGFNEFLTSREAEFFRHSLSRQEHIDLSWRTESLAALAWSVCLLDELALPTQVTSLDSLFPRMPPEVEYGDFASQLELRSRTALLEALDFYYCLHWLCRHRRVFSSRFEKKLNMEVIVERRRALEWLFCEEEWDEISLDT